jgi:hypothetical protein
MDRPQTLYEMMEQVAESIEARPLNYYQGAWYADAQLHYGKEACGTAYCRAGWMTCIGKEKPVHNNSVIQGYAMTLLENAGIPQDDVTHLFQGSALQEEQPFFKGIKKLMPRAGTPEYAELGAKGVRKFMERHAAKLKAAKLAPDKDGTLRLVPTNTDELS